MGAGLVGMLDVENSGCCDILQGLHQILLLGIRNPLKARSVNHMRFVRARRDPLGKLLPRIAEGRRNATVTQWAITR